MDWTPADEQRLAVLEARARELEAQIEGDPVADAHVAAVSKPIKPEAQSSGFSPIRLIVGTGRDIIENALEGARDLIKNSPMVSTVPVSKEAADAGREALGKGEIIDNLEGSENAAPAEKIIRAIAGFAVPYTGWAKAFGVAKAATMMGRVGKAAAAGAVTDFLHQDPQQSNLANVLTDTFGIDNETLDWLSSHEDENEIVQRLKAATTNLPVGIALDGLFELGAKGIRAYRVSRGAPDEAKGIVEALEHDYGVKRVKQPEPSAVDAEAGAIEPPKPSEEPFESSIHVAIRDNPPQSWEDVLSFLERTVDEPNLRQEELDELAKIVHGDPENALARIGIDPAKLDYKGFENPEGVQNLQKALINVYEKIGKRLGRTTERVTEADIYVAARSLASDAEVLQALFGRTENLPEVLMGARMFVGSHAHKLLADAEEALEELLKDGSGAAWHKFLESFHRHALYLGAVRGAGSEIARALRSLRFVARQDPKQATKMAATLEEQIPAGAKADAKEVADEQLNEVLSIEDDAERIMLLNKLLEKEGDVGELAQFVRGKSGSVLKRVDGVTRETVGNLFSSATAAFNITSGLTMLGLRALGRWMAAAGRLPGALFSAEQERLARIAAADAWAFTDGVMLAVGEAVGKTLAVIEREAAAELYLNADNLGLKEVAKRAAKANAKANKQLGKLNFERIDINAAPRQFAFNPADRRALEELMDSESLPQIIVRSLRFLARAGGAAANVAGSASRTGTSILINAPDQLVGTMAARAGAQSAAIREAANRAAELGIEGKDLSRYLKNSVAALVKDVDGWSEDGFTAGYKEVLDRAGEHEARATLFQDPLEFTSTRAMSRMHGNVLGASIFVPFMHTPLRILERTIIDYTPVGLLKSRMRHMILHGTPQQREQAISQLGLGMFATYMGYRMAEDRDIVGNDGGFVSTARLNRESYSLRIGADVFEFLRNDPLGSLLGMGADLRQAMAHYDPDDPEAEDQVKAFAHSMAWSVAANTLSKTWLTSIKALTELAGAFNDNQFYTGLDRYLKQTFARRIVPAAGLQKSAQMVFDPFEREALTFQDEMLKHTFGASKLPVKRDWLGDPERHNLGERFIGLTWKPENREPVIQELDRLSLSVRLPQKDIKGVKLNHTQFSRLLELRGNGVKRDFGTMKEALTALVQHPQWSSLTDPAKEAQIRKVTEGYTKAAKDALLAEDPELHARVIRKEAYDDARAAGKRPEELRKQNEALGRELGLIE